jgi:hypothetical protein
MWWFSDMQKFLLFLLYAILVGCASSRLYDSEPTNKSDAAFIRATYVKALIRPAHSDKSVEARITDDGIWVSSGTFIVRYVCTDPDQDTSNIHTYPYEKTIHIEAGYRYEFACYDKKKGATLRNIGWENVDYHTYAEALYEVPLMIRQSTELTMTMDGFRYEYYNDWGSSGDIEFKIYSDYQTHRLIAHLDQYRGSVMWLAVEAYESGVRNRDAMLKAIAPVSYEADVNTCPKIQDYYVELRRLFMARLNKPNNGPEKIYTDSPDVYRYYIGYGSDAMIGLYVLDDKDDLYKTTYAAMAYLKNCLAKQ